MNLGALLDRERVERKSGALGSRADRKMNGLKINSDMPRIKKKLSSLFVSLFLILTIFAPLANMAVQASENFTYYIVASLFDSDGNPIELKRNDLAQYKISPVSNPSVATRAYLPTSAFAEEGIDPSIVSSAFLPAEFIFEKGDTASINKVAEDMKEIDIMAPASNQIVFAYDTTLADTNILVELSSHKLSYWTYTTYPDQYEPLSDGSVLVPGDNVGIGLSVNLYYDANGDKAVETKVNCEKVKIISDERQTSANT